MSGLMRYPMLRNATPSLRPVLGLLIAGIANCLVTIPFAYGQQLDVSKHAQSQLADTDAKAIFSQASAVLQSKDGPDDISCHVTFSLAGSVSTFDLPTPAEIDTPGDFRAVCSRPGYVHVVNAINDCAGLTSPGIGGCSDTPGKCIIVVRLDNPVPPDEEGLLWAHEYGHTKGLQHRNDENALMNPYLGTTERRVNGAECSAFTGQAQGAANSHGGTPKPGIVEFVHRTYAEGIPFEVASSYSREDAQKLIAMLESPDEKPYLTNIVVTLGMIGDPAAVQPLRSFIEKGEGYIDPQTLRAKTSALIALGYVVNRHNDESALTYLAQGLNPKNWRDKNLKWTLRGAEDAEQRNISLIKASALGLGISGTPEAATALNSAQFTIRAVDPTASSAVNPVIEHALSVNKTIQHEGLLKYHLEMQKQ
jgi:hypothetical protein